MLILRTDFMQQTMRLLVLISFLLIAVSLSAEQDEFVDKSSMLQSRVSYHPSGKPKAPSYYGSATRRTEAEYIETDLCIYGSTPAGISAAIQARRLGISAVIIDPSWRLGGMTSSGLGWTDSGKKRAIGGIAREFYRKVGEAYGQEEAWTFEPHVAEKVYRDWLSDAQVAVYHGEFLKETIIENGRITSISTESNLHVRAKFYVDATYEGDLMAQAGVTWVTGREDNQVYGESFNGFQLRQKHQFQLPVDPYIREGDPSSGVLPGINPGPPPERGTGDNRIQAYNFRLCMTRNPDLRIPFTKPDGYNRDDYIILERYFNAGWDMHMRPDGSFRKFDMVTSDKTDTNNHGAFSSDFIGGNHAYPTASYSERETIYQAHVNYHRGLFWFLQNDPSVPREVAQAIRKWGLAGDEFEETGNWPPQLYIREARRMVSDVVMTENHCLGREKVDDSIGMGSYNMDSHNCQRVVVDGKIFNEGDVQAKLPEPYRISYRSIVPARNECSNLFVPVCVSSSHIAFGSIRMEPVYMVLGQSAATAAWLAIKDSLNVQDVPYEALKRELEDQGQVLDTEPVEN